MIHWCRVTRICVRKIDIIGTDNGLSPARSLVINGTNAGILIIWTLETKFSGMLIHIPRFSFKNAFENVCDFSVICIGYWLINYNAPGHRIIIWAGCVIGYMPTESMYVMVHELLLYFYRKSSKCKGKAIEKDIPATKSTINPGYKTQHIFLPYTIWS